MSQGFKPRLILPFTSKSEYSSLLIWIIHIVKRKKSENQSQGLYRHLASQLYIDLQV